MTATVLMVLAVGAALAFANGANDVIRLVKLS
jgi:phosphate/sulfate permease